MSSRSKKSLESNDAKRVDLADQSESRDFAGMYTRFLIEYVRESKGEDALERILHAAGEVRPVDELVDNGSWSTHAQFRSLLEATTSVLGDIAEIAKISQSVQVIMSVPELVAVFHSFGSPSKVYEGLALATSAISPRTMMETKEIGPHDWLLRTWFKEGFEPFREYCVFTRGLDAMVPVIFDFLPAEIEELACQCDGAPACEFRIRWTEEDDREDFEQGQFEIQMLQSRLEMLQHTIGELVSDHDVETVLPRIVGAVARAVLAPQHLLALVSDSPGGRRVYSSGLDESAAEELAVVLLEETGSANEEILAVDVTSNRRHYGTLAAIRDDGSFGAAERTILTAYAALAAAALDSAAALDAARTEGKTARALLELATSLAEVGSMDEMALRLARAAKEVVDCDRVLVHRYDIENHIVNVIAAVGYDEKTEAVLRSIDRVPSKEAYDALHNRQSHESFIRWQSIDSSDNELGEITGSVLNASISIKLGDEVLGWITVEVMDRPERLRDSSNLAERLGGLAAQAATAFKNASLLDAIQHQALHDALTGLPNRVLIHDRLEQALARGRRDKIDLAILFIDLDGFKDVNDTMGHEIGDRLLKEVAGRFEQCLRATDTVGRLGGDEFVVLSEGQSLESGPEMIAERLLESLKEPFIFNSDGEVSVAISASIGIARGTRQEAAELLRDADVALYAAKAAGKHRYMMFNRDMRIATRNRYNLELSLKSALSAGEFFVVYQPIFKLDNLEVSGAEALVRWRHPTRGLVGPDDFIPMLESSGLIDDVGSFVLSEACTQARAWLDAGHELQISVNVSGRQLDGGTFVDEVARQLHESGLPARLLMLEITETNLMKNTERVMQQLRALKKIGVGLAVDDFGTGYSSLAYVQQFPVDILKIDRSFISGAPDSPEGSALVSTLIQLGKALHLKMTAEGIETKAQLARLQLEGCDSGQGYLFAHPGPPELIDALFEDRGPSNADRGDVSERSSEVSANGGGATRLKQGRFPWLRSAVRSAFPERPPDRDHQRIL